MLPSSACRQLRRIGHLQACACARQEPAETVRHRAETLCGSSFPIHAHTTPPALRRVKPW